MNKILVLTSLILMIITITLATCGNAAQAALPDLPAAIQDPTLLEAWKQLNTHTEQVMLWDGRSHSGHDLAQFVLEKGIPVEWDAQKVCGSGSCSVLYNQDGVYVYEDLEPIYINPRLRNRGEISTNLILEAMAHEIYHRMQPYGKVDINLYEEYTAFYISTHISGATWTNIEAYDPLKPACLKRWFSDHNLLHGYDGKDPYIGIDLYPPGIAAVMDDADQNCPLPGE